MGIDTVVDIVRCCGRQKRRRRFPRRRK